MNEQERKLNRVKQNTAINKELETITLKLFESYKRFYSDLFMTDKQKQLYEKEIYRIRDLLANKATILTLYDIKQSVKNKTGAKYAQDGYDINTIIRDKFNDALVYIIKRIHINALKMLIDEGKLKLEEADNFYLSDIRESNNRKTSLAEWDILKTDKLKGYIFKKTLGETINEFKNPNRDFEIITEIIPDNRELNPFENLIANEEEEEKRKHLKRLSRDKQILIRLYDYGKADLVYKVYGLERKKSAQVEMSRLKKKLANSYSGAKLIKQKPEIRNSQNFSSYSFNDNYLRNFVSQNTSAKGTSSSQLILSIFRNQKENYRLLRWHYLFNPSLADIAYIFEIKESEVESLLNNQKELLYRALMKKQNL